MNNPAAAMQPDFFMGGFLEGFVLRVYWFEKQKYIDVTAPNR
jgi:hypothetical protein